MITSKVPRLRRKSVLFGGEKFAHCVGYEFLLVACPLPLLRWILNPRNNRRRYTPVESKLNVEFSRFTSASFSRAAGRHRFLLLLLGFASISNANSRRSHEERTPNNRRGASRRENKSRYQRRTGDDDDVVVDVVGYLNQCYHGIPLNQLGIKVITAPIKWNREKRDWGKCDRSRGCRSARQTDLARKNG